MNFGFKTGTDIQTSVQNDGSTSMGPKTKPAVPKKPVVATVEGDVGRTTHVKDMVRKLQAKEPTNEVIKKVSFIRPATKGRQPPEISLKEVMGGQTSKQTLEDLKAIDEDLEKLRKQIEERDKIISALREAAEAKDKKLENLMMEYSKLQSNGKMDLDASPEPNRATSSSPSSPPLCDGELCWTDSFVNKNYHEPVYAQLLNDHTALQKIYNELRTKLESKGKEEEEDQDGTKEENKMEGQENGINLIMAEQIRILKEREAQLISEAEELREQNDLMEFRILELEECRKEFLDKETVNEGKHRGEKIVWSERDLEDISDSGVMSLPTSEDLTSDSELGDGIRNYSPLGAVTNLSLLTTESCQSEGSVVAPELKVKKPFKFSECLQESGIFEDSESSSDCAITPTPSSLKLSKAVQTESALDKTLSDIIDSSCELLLTKNRGYLEDKSGDDLSAEISKLSVIQKRIQQKTSSSPTSRGPHTVHTCPHKNSLLFYEERLNQLEDKLKIYESSGDTKDSLLAKRLQKEVELAYRVKELTDKVSNLEAVKRRLEEEKCEFEEAENDTRFQCQRLEIRLQELIDKNTELELELERQKVIMTEERRREKKKGSLEGLISRYEQRNFELEEKEIEARQRLSMIEAAMPAILAWNVFRMIQNPDFANILPEVGLPQERDSFTNNRKLPEAIVFQRLEELLDDQKKLRRDYEKVEEFAADREKALRDKIEELEAKAAKDRLMLEEMTNALKVMKSEEKTGEREAGSLNSIRPEDVDLFEELKQMVANEIQLRAEIERLEKKEQAYMQSLEKADEIWAGMEEDYKRRLKEAETANNELQKRVSLLEATQSDLEEALNRSRDETESQPRFVPLRKKAEIEELVKENEKLKADINLNLERKFDEHRKFLEVENASLREEVKKLKTEFDKGEKNFQILEKELEMAKEELAREKETSKRLQLELEEKNRSVNTMEITLQNQISDLTQELSQKSKELSSLEVTVSELREEVETLEDKVAELVETIQNTIYNHEDGGKKAPAVELSLPVGKSQSHVVSMSLPESKDLEKEVEKTEEVAVVESEVWIMKENPLPSLQVLIPSPYRYRWLTYSVSVAIRQELKFIYPCPSSAKTFCLRHAYGVVEKSPESRENVDRKDEIFQLSIRNTELQQILEKMEEESRLKDKELEELQNIAQEIRKEQIKLELIYKETALKRKKTSDNIKSEERVMKIVEGDSKTRCCECGGETEEKKENLEADKARRSQSIDVLKMINPIVLKTSDHVSTSLSNLQVVIDNLQDKCRSNNFEPLSDEPKQKGDGCENEGGDLMQKAMEYLVNEKTEKAESEQKFENKKFESGHWELRPVEHHKRTLTNPKMLGKSSSACYFMVLPPGYPPSCFGSSIGKLDSDLNFVAPIWKLKQVGEDGLFLEWDSSRQPEEVIGYEIEVNGILSHRVRSSTRNKALLHPLDLTDRILIQLFAVSEKGRSIRCSHVTYPEYFVHKSESK